MKRKIRGAAVEKREAYASSLRAPQEGEAFRILLPLPKNKDC